MKPVHLSAFLAVMLWALPLWAILPPDAQFRKNEIVQQRVRARAEYEQQRKDYGQAMIASRIKVEASMKKPPWMRAGGKKVQEVADVHPFRAEEDEPQINHRFLVSVVLLILSGLAAGWIRYATRELDE